MNNSFVIPLSNSGPAVVRSPVVSESPKSVIRVAAERMISALFRGTGPVAADDACEIVGNFAHWTNAGWLDQTVLENRVIVSVETIERVAKAAVVPPLTTAQAVQRLHDASGLTWDQLSKLLGVSRRSVHLWAGGGTMSVGHEALLRQILAMVDQLPAATPDGRRASMLAPGKSGRSLYDELRADRARGERIIGSPFSFEQLIGAPDNEKA